MYLNLDNACLPALHSFVSDTAFAGSLSRDIKGYRNRKELAIPAMQWCWPLFPSPAVDAVKNGDDIEVCEPPYLLFFCHLLISIIAIQSVPLQQRVLSLVELRHELGER